MKTPYETMFLLPPTKTQEEIDTIIARVRETIEKKLGEVTNVDKMGVRKTAYLVNKLNSAYYVLVQYRGNGETIHEVERVLKNSDEVLKFLSTKIIIKPVHASVIKKQAKHASKEAARREKRLQAEAAEIASANAAAAAAAALAAAPAVASENTASKQE